MKINLNELLAVKSMLIVFQKHHASIQIRHDAVNCNGGCSMSCNQTCRCCCFENPCTSICRATCHLSCMSK